MSELDRGIGSQGLEQGGPNLGNDYSRPGYTPDTEKRDAIITPKEDTPKAETDETLNMDYESSRDLSGEGMDEADDLAADDFVEDDTDDDDDDMMEDDVLQGLDSDDDTDETEEDEKENDII